MRRNFQLNPGPFRVLKTKCVYLHYLLVILKGMARDRIKDGHKHAIEVTHATGTIDLDRCPDVTDKWRDLPADLFNISLVLFCPVRGDSEDHALLGHERKIKIILRRRVRQYEVDRLAQNVFLLLAS
jgi:hypothetical protein